MDQFIFSGVTLAYVGQKLKKNTKRRYAHANALFAMPSAPGILQGPQVARTMPSLVVVGVVASKASLLRTMPPVQRRYSSRPAVRRYELKRPAMETDITPLKAVVEPMFTRARIEATRLVNATA
jgi:hypothetical protein